MASVKAIPEGFNSVTPYLYIKGATKAIDFYKTAFGATEVMRMPGPNGTVAHAEIEIGNTRIMLSDERPDMGARSPQTVGGTPIGLHLYVDNVDATFKKAIDAGAKEDRPVKNEFYGDRTGSLTDPYGFRWFVATHVEDVAPEELKKRMAAMSQAAGG